MENIKRIGVLTSGGDAGMNAAIRAGACRNISWFPCIRY